MCQALKKSTANLSLHIPRLLILSKAMNQSSFLSISLEPAAVSGGVGSGSEGLSHGGYTDLHGEILTVTVSKVNKRLGIGIDGGADNKQKAVIIREIPVRFRIHVQYVPCSV